MKRTHEPLLTKCEVTKQPPTLNDNSASTTTQNQTMKNTSPVRLLAVLALGLSVLAGPTPAPAQSVPAPSISPAQRALVLLKQSTDKLSAAKSFTVQTVNSAESLSPAGWMITYFNTTEVAVQRPNKLVAKRTGDGPNFDIYYNGKTFSSLDQKLGLYAQMDAPPTLDALLPVVLEKTGMTFPFEDFLYGNVFTALTNGLTYADVAGQASVDKVLCDHLVFAGPGIEWQMWIGPEKDPLPRRLAVTYLGGANQPRFLVDFSKWNLKARLSDSRFELKPPAGAKQIQFRPHTATTKN